MKGLLLAIVLGLACSPAAAQNMLTNPNFDGGASGWTLVLGTFDSSRDAGGNPGTNGSLHLSYATASSIAVLAHECVTLPAGSSFSFGAQGWNDNASGLHVVIQWYSSTDCGTGWIQQTLSAPATAAGAWSAIAPVGGNPYTAPAGAQSATVQLALTTPSSGTGPWSGNIDNVYFGAGTFPVSLQTFSAE